MAGRAAQGGEHRGLRRRAAVLGSFLVLLALLINSLFGERGMIHVVIQRRHAEALRREVEGLRAQNAELAAQVRALHSDRRAIERLAREELGLTGPGETTFIVREESH
jgi:cell division protein FtsB